MKKISLILMAIGLTIWDILLVGCGGTMADGLSQSQIFGSYETKDHNSTLIISGEKGSLKLEGNKEVDINVGYNDHGVNSFTIYSDGTFNEVSYNGIRDNDRLKLIINGDEVYFYEKVMGS